MRKAHNKLTNEIFIERAIKIHNNAYDYSEVNYINSWTKVIVICPLHGAFTPTPNNHLSKKSKCPTCVRVQDLKSFLEKARIIHGDKYDYSLVDYIRNNSKIKIVCYTHGIFLQTPNDHLSGKGCAICGGSLKKDTATFIEQATIVHNNIYDYSETDYTGNKNKVKIICRKHGVFYQNPSHHLYGSGCPKCSVNVSRVETKWLDGLGIPQEYRQKILRINDKKFNTDAYDPITNTIYEFYGDFWHGNPLVFDAELINFWNRKKFGDLYQNTLNRENILRAAGYKIVSIWENDFRKGLNNASE